MKSNALYSFPAHTFRRLSSALVVALLSWLAAAATSARADVALEARIGFGQSAPSTSRYRPGSWTPITVYLTGQGVRGIGQLTVTVVQNGSITNYTRKISLHEGPLNETVGFVFNYSVSNGMRFSGSSSPEISVQLALDGRQLARKTFALPLSTASETYNILALTRDGSGMNFLNGKKLGLIHRGYNPDQLQNRTGVTPAGGRGSYAALRDVATSDLFYMDPHALPVSAQGYDMVDAVALADLPLDNLTEDQTAALRDYVRGGGLLILSGGGDLVRLKSQFYQDLLPVQPVSVETVRENAPEIALLQARYHQPIALQDGAALTVGALKPGAATLFGRPGKGNGKGSTGYGLIATRPYGCGTVIFTAFDFLAPEFRSWKQSPSLWRDLLRSGSSALSPRAVMAAQSINRSQNGSGSLADALAGKQASSAPSFYVVAVFLGTYIFLLVPASYFLLKKLDKRELAWFTVPALVMCFTVISYLIALSIKGAALTVNRVVVLETQANTDQAAGLGEMTLYSPRRARFDIAPAPPGEASLGYHNVVPDEIFTPNDGAGSNLTVEQDQIPVIRQAEVRFWDKRSFSTPIAPSLGGPVEITAAMTSKGDAQDAVHITVTNKTRFTLRDCALVNDKSQIANIGVLAPGESRSIPQSFPWSSDNSARLLHLPPVPNGWQMVLNVNGTRNQTPVQVQNSLKFGLTQMLTGASGAAYNGMGNIDDSTAQVGQADNAFVAWIDAPARPLLDVQIDGKPAPGTEAALLYVHLPIPANAPLNIARVANPFLENAELNILDEKPSASGHGIIPR